MIDDALPVIRDAVNVHRTESGAIGYDLETRVCGRCGRRHIVTHFCPCVTDAEREAFWASLQPYGEQSA